MKNTGRLALLEGHWGFKNPSMTVSPLFDMVLSSQNLPLSVVDYERWRTRDHLSEALARHAGSAEVIYLGGHGETSGVPFDDEAELSVAAIAKILGEAGSGSLKGVYLSLCSMGSPETARKILKAAPDLEWVAGYATPVAWAESAAVDLLFFSQWYGQGQNIEKVAGYMSEWAGRLTLADDVQFNIYTRDGALIGESE